MSIVVPITRAVKAGKPIRDRLAREMHPTHQATVRTPVVMWPLADLTPSIGESWLDGAVVGTTHQHQAKALWDFSPTLRDATHRLAVMITPKWPTAEGKSLLAESVRRAVLKTEEAMARGEKYQGRVIGVYLYWLVSGVRDVGRLAVFGTDSRGVVHQWPYFERPLRQWADDAGLDRLYAHLVSPEPDEAFISGLKLHLLTSIADPTDVGYMTKHAPNG